MQDALIISGIESRYSSLSPLLDERLRRHWAAAEARSYGWGGIRAVSCATCMSPNTIKRGLQELDESEQSPSSRIRKPGGGRKRSTEKDSQLASALEKLVDPVTRGDPESPLRWTCKSTAQLSQALHKQGHTASPSTVGRLLKAGGYSLQGNRKTKEGGNHPDRNAQFEHIDTKAKHFQQQGQPVISVDTKKKELIGPFKNMGKEWQPKGAPEEVRVYDFIDKDLGKAIPYGIYDLTKK